MTIQLNDFCLALPTVLRDSLSLVQDLEAKQFPDDCEVFGGDVRSLYPSINTIKGISIVRKVLIDRSGWSGWKIDFICDLLALVLNFTIFKFRGKFFIQINGTAMGV